MRGPRALVWNFLAFGLALMFAVSFLQNLNGEHLVHSPPAPFSGKLPHNDRSESSDRPQSAPGMPGALSAQDSARLAELMARVRNTPHDADLLLEIAQIFMAAREWPQAEHFLRRAAADAPTDGRPLHFLGVCQTSREEYAQAAASFEQALALSPNPSTRFNLAVLRRYYLNDPERARALLENVAAAPDAPEALKAKAAQELRTLEKPH